MSNDVREIYIRRQIIVDVANCLGDRMMAKECNEFMDEIRGWDLDSKYYVYDYLDGGPLFTALSEYFGEMGY